MNTSLFLKVFTIFFVLLVCNKILFAQSNFFESNNPPISPKWVFEPWVWEDEGTRESLEALINDYRSHDIPVGAVIIDSPWESPNSPDNQSNTSYNTFEFDDVRYNDAAQLISNLHNLDPPVKVILWITGNMTTNCDAYDDASDYFVRNSGDPNDTTTIFWKGNRRASHFDFYGSDKDYWDSMINKILDNYDIDGWKMDQSDRRIRDGQLGNSILTSDPINPIKGKTEYANDYYRYFYDYTKQYYDENNISKLPMIMARPYSTHSTTDWPQTPYWYAPIDVNTAGWVGDQAHSWEGMKEAMHSIFISVDRGYATIGSDIGGYDYGTITKNLFIRWTQMGGLMPIMENGGKGQHLPWMFDMETEDIYRYYATLHHELVPYLYSYDIEAHNTNTSIVRPIGNRGTGIDSSNWKGDWSYFLGDEIFVAAIYDSVDYNTRFITFPSGKWIKYWDENLIYEEGDNIDYDCDSLMGYPIFIRAGAIIPMNVDSNITGHGTVGSADRLTVLVYPRDTTSFNFHKSIDESILIENFENTEWDSIKISQSTEKFIFRVKLTYKPYSIKMNKNYYISEVVDSTEFDNSEEGWRYDASKKYCWIKFSSNGLETNLKISKNHFTNIYPSNYETGILDVGEKYYIDRNFIVESVPEEYQFLPMIKTANDDKDSIGLNFHFELNKTSKVYIAYDPRLDTPDWISNEYSFTGKSIKVSDIGPDSLIVWEKLSEPGLVILGDNEATSSEASMYFVFCKETPIVKLYCKIFLEGPFSNHKMLTSLNENEQIPLAQPFNIAPWNYEGNEIVEEIPTNVVDWVLIELRNKNNSTLVESRRAGFILRDGSIVDTNGSSPVQFLVEVDNYYIVLKHRNHLGVMSSEHVNFTN